MTASLRNPIRGAALATALVLLGTAAAGKATIDPSGRELYLDECAPCHGPVGRGDGPEADSFSPRPRDLRTGFLEIYDDEEIVARLRDGTPLLVEFDPEGLRTRVRQVEQLTAHLRRLPAIDWAGVRIGSEMFVERCTICHGAFGKPWPPPFLPEGVQRPPRDLWDPEFQHATSDEELIAVIQHGRGVMPGIPGPEGAVQAKKLLPFIRLLSPGFEIYSYYCAVCHGDDGNPAHGMAPEEAKPHVIFDRAWLAKKKPEQLRVDVSHMLTEHGTGMPHFREIFADDELKSIVKYLKRLPHLPSATP
jgi:mono/diheme cytochrome c family protein